MDIFTRGKSSEHTRRQRHTGWMRRRTLLQKHRVELHLVNRLELLRDGKDGLDVVVAQLLDQVSDGRIVLRSRDVRVTTKATNGKLDPRQDNKLLT